MSKHYHEGFTYTATPLTEAMMMLYEAKPGSRKVNPQFPIIQEVDGHVDGNPLMHWQGISGHDPNWMLLHYVVDAFRHADMSPECEKTIGVDIVFWIRLWGDHCEPVGYNVTREATAQ